MGGWLVNQPPHLSLYDFFLEQCPYYMSFGMTYDDFWHGDVHKAKIYRKMHELKQKEQNQVAWLNGLYIFRAINVSFSEDKEETYPEEPLPLTMEDKEAFEEREAKRKQEKIMRKMTEFMNRQKRKEGE